MQFSKILTLTGLMLPYSASWGAWYDAVEPTRNDFGGIGLWQMPTARMASEGDISFNFSRIDPYVHGSLNLQPLPWMAASIRYVSITNRLYGSEELSGDQSYKDKGIDVKFRLVKEDYYWPDIAVGFQDIGGTGLFAGEYINASKNVGPFNFTLGLGWGYLGNAGDIDNPFCRATDRMCDRHTISDINDTGKVNFNYFFRGERVALFGGVEYQTPWDPLTLKLEWDGNDYQHEPQDNNQPQSSRFNIGMVLKPTRYLDLKLAYERGNTLAFGVTLHANLINDMLMFKTEPAVQPLNRQATNKTPNWDKMAENLAENAGFKANAIYQNNRQVIVTGSQTKYRERDQADTRAAAVVYNLTEMGTREFKFIEETSGMTTVEATVAARDLEKVQSYDYDFNDKPQLSYASEPETPIGEQVWQSPASPWSYSVSPGLNQTLGGPDGFFLYQIILKGGLTYHFTDSFEIGGNLSLNMLNNYDNFKYDAPSNLPRVRTYIREYLTTSEFGVNDLQATWFNKLGRNWYSQVYAGYLEFMYGGAGGEILYRPLDSNFAVGMDINGVKQRDFDQRFGFRDYETVTGHLSFYYRMPWYNITTQVDVGRYLAKDMGATFTVSREFDNGVRLGAYATFTDVSAEEYGEGSFTKGIYLSIPFEMFSVTRSVSRANFGWTPLTRDGGQKLNRKYALYYMTEQRGAQAISTREGQ